VTKKAVALSREIYFDNRKSRLFIKEGQEAPKNRKSIERKKGEGCRQATTNAKKH
jgi:hypothetical protein